MTKKILFSLVLLAFAMGLAGCGGPRVLGARALLPLQAQDADRVWIYMDTNNQDRNGVYRCVDAGQQVTCVRANLQ
ncbi:MAG: hypothetical protein KC619_07210 [Myxococcales bacterium]|nr:hypothetical protein [Myxococcales bacterium]